MSKYPIISEDPENDNWSEFVHHIPRKDGPHRTACCDCGLVHDMEIKIVKITKRVKNGIYWVDHDDPTLTVVIRYRRNKRSTAQKRRHMPKENP